MTGKWKCLVTVILCGTVLSIMGNSTHGAPAESPVTDFLPNDQGTVAIDNLNMREFRKGSPVHEVQASHVLFSEKEKKVKLTDVSISFAEETGVQGNMKSKEVIYDISSKIAWIQGDVKYTSKTGVELTCNSLTWNLDKDQIHVPGKFYVIHKNDTLHGSNLVTNSKLEYSSMQDIQGVIR
jgi:lipopolysaccharide assembly outer membrane protein LptD (OstA)